MSYLRLFVVYFIHLFSSKGGGLGRSDTVLIRQGKVKSGKGRNKVVRQLCRSLLITALATSTILRAVDAPAEHFHLEGKVYTATKWKTLFDEEIDALVAEKDLIKPENCSINIRFHTL